MYFENKVEEFSYVGARTNSIFIQCSFIVKDNVLGTEGNMILQAVPTVHNKVKIQ